MQASPALFIADARALDFLNSVATPADAPVEWLDDGAGLLSWLRQAELVSAGVLEEIRLRSLPGELDRAAAEARSLREWFRAFVRERAGNPLSLQHFKELQSLNRLLERDESFSQISTAPGEKPVFELRSARRWRSPEALLFPIAETLARFVCTEDFTHVRACEGPACTLLFADHTRGKARRWCSMSICGNRAKQAAHRQRLKAER